MATGILYPASCSPALSYEPYVPVGAASILAAVSDENDASYITATSFSANGIFGFVWPSAWPRHVQIDAVDLLVRFTLDAGGGLTRYLYRGGSVVYTSTTTNGPFAINQLNIDMAASGMSSKALIEATTLHMPIQSGGKERIARVWLNVTYTSLNHAPVAQDDTLTAPFETAMAGQLVATDEDDDPLTYAVDTEPEHGAVDVDAATGAYVYTPDSGYDGPDSFTFHANDGEDDSNVATISITVDAEPPANPPTGDWTYEQGCQVLVTDASGIEAGEGEEIVAVSWAWGDDTDNGAGVIGKHIYDDAATYPVTCIVQYAGGELFYFPQSIAIIPIDFTLQQFGNIVLVDAGENQPPASSGYPITAYAWAWGDGSAYGSGVATSHRYIMAGSYLIVLALTIEGHILYASKGVSIMSDTATSGLQADSNQHLILDSAAITLNYGDAETERVLGVTRGGTRITLGRTHRNMEPDGALGPVKGFRRLETVAPSFAVPMLDMRVENLLVALAGSTGTEEGETTVIEGAEVADADYIDNVAFVARYSGSTDPIIFVLKNVLITTPFDLQTADKNEPVLELTFEAHFDPATPRTEPWEIIHPMQAASGS